MKIAIAILTTCLLVPTVARRDDGDKTLEFYLSQSDLVVIGKMTKDPFIILNELGVPNHICEFAVADVLQGDPKLAGETIRINIKRFEKDAKDRHPLLKKDAEAILFLDKNAAGANPMWRSADFWFGIQQPSPWMARSLKRLAK